MQLKVMIRSARPAFLILTPICVLLGVSLSLAAQSSLDYFAAMLVLIAATAAHISVNALNEYFDFKSGLDAITQRTPFSGGSGALPAYPEQAQFTLLFGLLALALTIVIGIYFIVRFGLQIFPFGVVGVALIVTYTQWLNRVPWVCLIAPGLGFGTLMVVGTQLVLTGHTSMQGWLVSLVPFFLVNNLLLLNQYPDIQADASVGRRTFPIVFGVNRSNIVYVLFAFAAYALIVFPVYKNQLPRSSLIALMPLALSLWALAGAIKYRERIGFHPKYLAVNVAATLLTPLLLGLSIFVGKN